MKTSRNQQCQCSSGKKFKDCCLLLQQERRRANRLEEPIREKITRFFASKRFASDLEDAITHYTDKPESLEDRSVRLNFNDWYIHDYILKDKNTTIIKLFAEEMKDTLDEFETETVSLWSDSPLRLYEVTNIRKGTGFFAKDVFDDTQRFVHDVNISTSLARYDLLFTRLYPIGTITRTAGGVYAFTHTMLEKVRQFILHEYERSGCKDLEEYFKKNSLSVIRYFDVLKNSQDIHVTPEGNIITVSRAEYSITEPAKIKRYFDRSPDFAYAGRLGKKYRYDIVEESNKLEGPAETIDAITYQAYYISQKKGQPNLKVIANIGFDRKRLYIECMSEQRLVKSKKIVERLGSLVKHRGDTYGIEQDYEDESVDEPELDEGQAAEMTAEFFEKYYEAWLDTRIPFLGGKTPLEASNTAKGRELLKDIIKDIENMAEHNGLVDASYIKKLKSELDLE
ncbi:MAG: SEC-C metal-binding domain-containing protein [Rhabdochlamydiaceae bacterium]